LFDGKRCVGVRYNVHGQQREARATREVVVSAGSINSPQLLELSGIGLPAPPIRAYVRTRVGLEAPDAAISWIPFLVGENFQLAKTSGITAIMNILRSESTGSIHVASSRPDT